MISHRIASLSEKLAHGIAWALPQRVVYHALIRAWAAATTGPYSDTHGPSVTASEVARRWEKGLARTWTPRGGSRGVWTTEDDQ